MRITSPNLTSSQFRNLLSPYSNEPNRVHRIWFSSFPKTIFIFLMPVIASCLLITNVSAAPIPVANPSFEILESTHTGLFPDTFGDWLGDTSAIVTAQDGIVPADGNRMLQFLATSTGGAAATRISSDVQQLIDVNSLTDDVSTGDVVVEFSAWFNRVAGDSTTDTEFVIQITTLTGEPIDYLSMLQARTWLTRDFESLITDSDPNTWQQLSMSVLLPEDTDYFAIQVSAFENVIVDAVFPEFAGHYADNVTLNSQIIVPEPSSYSLMVFGMIVSAVYLFTGRGRGKNITIAAMN